MLSTSIPSTLVLLVSRIVISNSGEKCILTSITVVRRVATTTTLNAMIDLELKEKHAAVTMRRDLHPLQRVQIMSALFGMYAEINVIFGSCFSSLFSIQT